jgi:hypothetical protein
MPVGAQVVKPHAAGVDLPILGLGVEEHHIGLDALRVEDARGQAQHGVNVAGLQQLAADLLARAALEQHVVGQHHRRLTVHLEHADDVLQEVELLVGRGFPEVLALAGQRLAVLLAVAVGDGHAALLAEGRGLAST